MSNPHDAEQAPENFGPLTQYTMYSVFRRPVGAPQITDLDGALAELEQALAPNESNGVTLRGLYDVGGFRHDGDVLVWMHSEHPEQLQAAIRRVRTTPLFEQLELTWQVSGVHVAAEFNDRHMPAYMMNKAPKGWICIYPFVRSYEWYLLPEEERSKMLRDHGMLGAQFKSVLANTVGAFAISDYEWMLSFEDDELINIVDMMRELRYTEARLHVREETPFYTGRRIEAAELPIVLRHAKEA